MVYLDIALRWLHILSAIALMGGTIFVRFAFLPTLQTLSEETRREVEAGVRSRWSKVVMAAVGVLLLTGIVNMGLIASRYKMSGIIETPQYHALLGVKFLLALPIFFIASRLVGRSDAAAGFRRNARFWVTLNLILALIIVMIAGVLRFADRQLKPSKNLTQSVSRAL